MKTRPYWLRAWLQVLSIPFLLVAIFWEMLKAGWEAIWRPKPTWNKR